MPAPETHFDFARDWQAQILASPPMIKPARAFLYPQDVAGEEEALSRGALLVQIKPGVGREFLANCALGFAEEGPLSGVWSCPHPAQLCAVAGGYAYIIETDAPKNCTHLELRPVVEVLVAEMHRLLIFVGFHSIAAWGTDGLAWQTPRITWEGLRVSEMTQTMLCGFAWDMPSDSEIHFSVNLLSGEAIGGSAPK